MSKVTAEGKQSWALKVLFGAALCVIAAASVVAWIFWKLAGYIL
jgi:hypothetical protein